MVSGFVVLDRPAIDPFPFVLKHLVSVHLPMAISLISLELPFILPAIRPSIDTVALFIVVSVASIVTLGVLVLVLFPYPCPRSDSLFKLPLVVGFICPNIMPITLRQPIRILPLIHIPIAEMLDSLPMFQPILKFPFIQIPYFSQILPLHLWCLPAPEGNPSHHCPT